MRNFEVVNFVLSLNKKHKFPKTNVSKRPHWIMHVNFLSANCHDTVFRVVDELEPRFGLKNVFIVDMKSFASSRAKEDPGMGDKRVDLKQEKTTSNLSRSHYSDDSTYFRFGLTRQTFVVNLFTLKIEPVNFNAPLSSVFEFDKGSDS
jgi:hypothetical protein